MLDTVTSKASPTAASQAAKTRSKIGIMKDIVRCKLRMVRVLRINMDNIMLSKHSNEDIRWDRKINIPNRAIINARIMLMKIEGILIIMK